MAALSSSCRTFVDANGVRWGAAARIVGEGSDAIPVGFTFRSESGERRALDGSTADSVSWEELSNAGWCDLLAASRPAHTAAPAPAMLRPRYLARRSARRP